MEINIKLNTNDFNIKDDYCNDVSFENYIIDKVTNELIYKVSNSKHWQETFIINRLVDSILKESNGLIKEKFASAIESKINRSNITSKINKKISGITQEEIMKHIIKDMNIEKTIRSEVRSIMEEKLK